MSFKLHADVQSGNESRCDAGSSTPLSALETNLFCKMRLKATEDEYVAHFAVS